MFEALMLKLNYWMERSAQRRNEDWLASSDDAEELDRRLREMDSRGRIY
ncbi:DUF3563 family protein [Cupriavidus sp. 30B13]